MFFKLVLKAGHMGAGSSFTMVRYEKAPSVSSLLDRLRTLPRLKGKKNFRGIESIVPITQQEYFSGLARKSSLINCW